MQTLTTDPQTSKCGTVFVPIWTSCPCLMGLYSEICPSVSAMHIPLPAGYADTQYAVIKRNFLAPALT